MMKFFAIVALVLFATADATTAVTGGAITRGTSYIQGLAGGNLVITFTTNAGLANNDVVTFTPLQNAAAYFSGASPTCSATGTGITSIASAATTSTGVLAVTVTGTVAASVQVVITCTNSLALNAAAGAKTFTIATTSDATVETVTGYTTTAGFAAFTATRASLVTAADPGNLVVTITPKVLIDRTTGTITLTPSTNIFDADSTTATTCTVVITGDATTAPTMTAAVSLTSTTVNTQKVILTMGGNPTDTIAVDEVATITCTGNMAVVNGAAASAVTFGVKTSGDTTGLAAQAGYTIAAASAASSTASVSMLTMLALAGVAMRQ